MARPGDPFETEELDAQRSRQRRLLAMVSLYDLERVIAADDGIIAWPPPDITTNPIGRAVLEAEFRRLADTEMSALSDVLEAEAELSKALAVQDFFNAPYSGRAPRHENPFKLVKAAAERRTEQGSVLTDNHANTLHRVIGFLLWADHYADDGYRDRGSLVTDPIQ
jgi:hypothetical protein